jgi:polyphosphate kinase 2
MADQLPDADTVRALCLPAPAVLPADPGPTAELLEKLAAELGLTVSAGRHGRLILTGPAGDKVRSWQQDYPYAKRLGRQSYKSAKRLLQIELLKLQRTVKQSGDRVLIIFEGRDAAGKGGTIRRFTENLNPRGVRVVALDKPAEHEQGDNYLRRFLPHLPAAGEIVLFDRSWYNRAGVEAVMGFCRPQEYTRFLHDVPAFERQLAADGITVIKLWFSVTRTEQLSRFIARHGDPVKRWKLSPTDLAALDKWDEYTAAKEAMFRHTDVPQARWTVIKSNDKRRARLEVMRYILSLFAYDGKAHDLVGQLDPLIVGPPALPAVPVTRIGGPAGLAQPAHLVQGDAGQDGTGQRLAGTDPERDDRVALLCDEPG